MNSVRKSGTHSQSSEFQRTWEALILQPGQLSPSPRHFQVPGDSTTVGLFLHQASPGLPESSSAFLHCPMKSCSSHAAPNPREVFTHGQNQLPASRPQLCVCDPEEELPRRFHLDADFSVPANQHQAS